MVAVTMFDFDYSTRVELRLNQRKHTAKFPTNLEFITALCLYKNHAPIRKYKIKLCKIL